MLFYIVSWMKITEHNAYCSCMGNCWKWQARLLEDGLLSLQEITNATLSVISSQHYFADHDDLEVSRNFQDQGHLSPFFKS